MTLKNRNKQIKFTSVSDESLDPTQKVLQIWQQQQLLLLTDVQKFSSHQHSKQHHTIHDDV